MFRKLDVFKVPAEDLDKIQPKLEKDAEQVNANIVMGINIKPTSLGDFLVYGIDVYDKNTISESQYDNS